MNLGFNGFGQMSGWGQTMTRPQKVLAAGSNAAYQAALKNYTDNLPNPRGYYFQEVFEKDVAKAEASRNKNILSSSQFNSGVTVGRGNTAGEYFYRNDAAMRTYAITYDKKFVEAINKAKSKIEGKLTAARYKQLPNGNWIERSDTLRQPSKALQVQPGRSVATDKLSDRALPGFSPATVPSTPAGQSFTPSPDALAPLPDISAGVVAAPPTTPWLLYLAGAAVLGGGAYFLLRRRGKSS